MVGSSVTSCPALCRASTSFLLLNKQDVDGRDTPGTKCPGVAMTTRWARFCSLSPNISAAPAGRGGDRIAHHERDAVTFRHLSGCERDRGLVGADQRGDFVLLNEA